MNNFRGMLWQSARAEGCVEDAIPPAGEIQICPSRLHADFARLLRGADPVFPENAPALARIRAELDLLGFVGNPRSRFHYNRRLRLAGEVDAHGRIEGMNAILDLKVVAAIPAVLRPQDAAQLLLYDLLRNGSVGGSVLVALYVQNHAPFRAESRVIVDPAVLAPLVTELLS